MVKGDVEIVVVQGDSYQKNVYIENVDSVNIDAIYMSCKDLGINKELTYDSENNKYIFYMSPEETTVLKSIVTTFDITIYFVAGQVRTVSYKAQINVLPKTNKVQRES